MRKREEMKEKEEKIEETKNWFKNYNADLNKKKKQIVMYFSCTNYSANNNAHLKKKENSFLLLIFAHSTPFHHNTIVKISHHNE